MKHSQIMRLLALLGLCLLVSSCRSDGNEPKPNPDPDPNLPQNLREVSALLRSAGHLPDAVEAKFTVKEGAPTKQGQIEYQQLIGQKIRSQGRKVTRPMQYDFAQNSDEFAILDPWPSILWPGCLIQGNSIRGDKVPNAIPLYEKRKPGRIMLQVVSGADKRDPADEEGFYIEVKQMRESNVLQAQNDLIRRYMQSGMPASVSYTMEVVHNIRELAIHTGLDVKKVFAKIRAFAGQELRKDRHYVLVRLYQRFFTMSYEDPNGGFLGTFTPDIQAYELEPFTGNGNPMCFVSSVSYGRVYYLLYESEESSERLYAGLSTYFSGLEINGHFRENEVVRRSHVKMLQRGGDAQAGLQAATSGRPEDVARFIVEGARFSDQNVGAPISFTIKHLYDNTLVRMSNTMSYSYDKTEFIPEEKKNNFAIRLKDISTSTTGLEEFDPSNRGYIKLTQAIVRYYPVDRSKPTKIADFWDQQNNSDRLPKTVGITEKKFIHANQVVQMDCGKDYDRVTLSLHFEVLPYARKGWSKDKGTSPEEVILEQDFRLEDGGWKAEDTGEGSGSTIPFRHLGMKRKMTKLMVNIQANYAVYIDNHHIEGQPGK